MITKEILLQIQNQTKILKSDIIVLFNGVIYGGNKSDVGPTILKSTPFIEPEGFNYELRQFYSKDLANLISKGFNKTDEELIVNNFSISYGDIIFEINNEFQFNSVLNSYNNLLINSREDKLILSELDARPYMETVLQCKSEEKDLIKINRNMMMMYHGSMLPINKSDKINMFIYSYSPIVDIYNINIIKKTNIIKVFTACLKIS